MGFNKERAQNAFKDHIATFKDYGDIKILDFKNPESSDYRIRFLFEEEYCRCHISGDLGELIATNYNNMVYSKFKDFVNDPGYFEGKIDCHSRALYSYDWELAKKEIEEHFKDWDADEFGSYCACNESKEDVLDSLFWDIECDFNERTGIGSKGMDALLEIDDCAWDWATDIGKEETGIIELYLYAFKLAQEQLKEKENV